VTQNGPTKLIERLLDALAAPARRERTAVTVLLGYVALWTLYGTLAKGSQDINSDMSEQYVLSRELAWGYPKHPPLAMAVVRAWFTVFPTAEWAYYLLAVATAGLALWIAWRLSARFLDGEKRVVGLALLTLVPFFNFHALKFNQNTVLMPLWAATTLWFLRSFETRRVLDAALAGVGAAACMYGKYWSIFLLLGLALAALLDRRRATYFHSAAPWVTIAAGTVALAPHAAWIVPLVFVFAAARPGRAALSDMGWPASPERRLAALAFWTTLLLPPLIAIFTWIRLVSLWTMSAWTLLPVMLLSSPLIVISRRNAVRVLALAVLLPLVMVTLAPAIAFGIHRAGPAPDAALSSVLVEPIEQLWRATTDRPLKVFAGYDDFTDGVAFYMRSHPLAAHVLDGPISPAMEQRVGRDGIALLCPARARAPSGAADCVDAANSLAARFPRGKQQEVEVSRRYFGVEGTPARYLLFAIPPRQP